MKVVLVAGARPNFMKIAPIVAAMRQEPSLTPILVHTGQHYDEKMSNLFFRQLGIPSPDVNLEVGSGSHAAQTAAILTRFEPVLLEHKPDHVLVVGDVNSTIACGLAAVKLGIKLIHVEAGLRSFDRSMPEEINRVLTDAISSLLFCSEPSGVENLRREGVAPEKIHLVGNVMIDSLHRNREAARNTPVLGDLNLRPREYALLTLHRPSNVDDAPTLGQLLGVLDEIARDLPVVFPVHPRTRARLVALRGDSARRGWEGGNWRLIEPLGYLEFLHLMANARLVLTDSGGVQEETTVLGVPCLTLRQSTERPVTVEMGTNQLVGTEPARILAAFRDINSGRVKSHRIPPGWDGRAAERIVQILLESRTASSGSRSVPAV